MLKLNSLHFNSITLVLGVLWNFNVDGVGFRQLPSFIGGIISVALFYLSPDTFYDYFWGRINFSLLALSLICYISFGDGSLDKV